MGIPQDKANEILDMSFLRVKKEGEHKIQFLAKKAMILHAMDMIANGMRLLSLSDVIECYRAALDTLELLEQENARYDKGEKK